MTYVAGNFDSNHVYVQWGGALPGNEQWSCGLRMRSTDSSAIAESDPTFLAAITTALTNFHARGTSNISPRAIMQFVKVNAVGVDGHYLYPTTQQAIVANLAGTGPTVAFPPNQVALAISLTTGVSRGPAHRGRFYMPLPAINSMADGLIDTTGRDQVKGSAMALLNDLNAITANYKVAVFSRKFGAPAHRLVTGIQVGRVLDTQRRRRNKLAESY